MNKNDDLVKRLNFENFIWIIFIVVSVIDIYGDELIKKGVKENNKEAQRKAENLFLGVALISILVYIYFFYRNYIDYKNHCNKYYEVRLFGSALILIGTLCLIYFLLYNSTDIELPSNI